MTDHIDPDDIDTETEREMIDDGDDWLNPDGSPDASKNAESPAGDDSDSGARLPGVPQESEDKPPEIPGESGGFSAEATGDADQVTAASGPHGGGADDLTLALTYDAVTRVADPQAVLGDANPWADWIGVVGDVPTYVLTTFQREHDVNLEFFNGSGIAPTERLAGIDEHSMFYSDRIVLMGIESEDELAKMAGWEFVPPHSGSREGRLGTVDGLIVVPAMSTGCSTRRQ